MAFERIGGEEIWSGKIASVRKDRFRYDDGEEADREIVGHPGAVTVLAHDDEFIYLVAQPREPVDEQALVELPAGKLDEEGESPLDTAKRELAEEIGKGAHTWKHLATFWGSPGFSNEEIHLYLATDLYDQTAEVEENERIEVKKVPLSALDQAIEDCRDSKSLVGLLWLKAYGDGGP
jgi:8-oxo-dGTP pyrophosphatase MutT (NUDIX family)